MDTLFLLSLALLGIIGLVIAPYALVYGAIALSLRRMGIQPHPKFQIPRGAFPVQPVDDGIGRYMVFGVERETEKDQLLTIDADSRANALVKAELRGIVVTRIEKLV